MEKVEKLLAAQGAILADGATGTNLFDVGLVSGQAPEIWNFEEPDKIRHLHRSFLEAGSDLLVTNSFGASARRLHLHDLDDRVVEVNAVAAQLAHEVADEFDREIIIAGSVGPTGDLFFPLGELTAERAVEVFVEQMKGLKEGGADLAWVETMSAPEEVDAALEAAAIVGLPATVCVSFDTAGRSMMGLSPEAFAKSMATHKHRPVAFGSNCGVGASDLVNAVVQMVPHADGIPVIAKANAGIPQVKGDSVVYSGSPELMHTYVGLARDAGALIIGGCCGSRQEHVEQMRHALDHYENGGTVDLERIVKELGELVAPPSEAKAEGGSRRRRRAR